MGEKGDMNLREEQPEDGWEVEALFDLAFAPGREALSSYRLRDGVPPIAPLCLVARDREGVLAGAIRVWPVRIGDKGHPAVLLGPVAVHPTRQGEGIGGLMIRAVLDKAAALGWERMLLVGDEPYYRRFGFTKAEGIRFPPPTNPERLLAHSLVPDAWEGVTGEVRKWTEQDPAPLQR